jgi:hypothetical protein
MLKRATAITHIQHFGGQRGDEAQRLRLPALPRRPDVLGRRICVADVYRQIQAWHQQYGERLARPPCRPKPALRCAKPSPAARCSRQHRISHGPLGRPAVDAGSISSRLVLTPASTVRASRSSPGFLHAKGEPSGHRWPPSTWFTKLNPRERKPLALCGGTFATTRARVTHTVHQTDLGAFYG